MIKQVLTQKNRLLLEQKTIKFRSSSQLKKILSPTDRVSESRPSITVVDPSRKSPVNPTVKPKTKVGEIPIQIKSDKKESASNQGEAIKINKGFSKQPEDEGKVFIKINDLRDLEQNAQGTVEIEFEKAIESLPKVVKIDRQEEDIKTEIYREPIKVIKSKFPKRLELKQVKIHARVDKEKVRAEIYKRFQALSKRSLLEKSEPILRPGLDTSAEGKLFGALFKTLLKNQLQSLSFSLNAEESIPIYQNNPRKKMADLPQTTVRKFLNRYLDFDVFTLPQERFVKVAPSSKIKEKIIIKAFSIPTHDGASFNLKLEKA